MALLADMPKVIRAYGVWGFTKRVWEEVDDDHLFTWAAALAYSWLFAIFPFMIFLMTLMPYLPEEMKQTAYEEIHGIVYEVFPGPAAQAFWGNIDHTVQSLLHDKQGKLTTRLIGLGLALWAASGGMAMTMTALDMCYEVHRGRPFYINRPLAIGMTLIVAVFLLLVVCLLPVGTFVKHWLLEHSEWWRDKKELLVLFELIRWPLAVFFLIAALSVLYQKGPSIKRRWTWITPGGVFCVVVWVGLGLLFRLYVTEFANYDKTYGTVGGVVVLLLFFYIDAVVLLVGAEINSEVDFKVLGVERGSRDYREAESIYRPRKKKVKAAAGLAENPTLVQTTGSATAGNVIQVEAGTEGVNTP